VSAVRGALGGALSLIALQTVVSTDASATRLGGLFSGIASIVDRGLNPSVALIPDLRKGASGSTSTSSYTTGSSSTGTAQLPGSQFNPSTVPTPRPANPAPVIAPPTTYNA
jgi:hypothetical protein